MSLRNVTLCVDRGVDGLVRQQTLQDANASNFDKISTPAVLLRSFGNLNMSGFGNTSTKPGLNAPYDAKVNGDYTGLTPPFADEGEDD